MSFFNFEKIVTKIASLLGQAHSKMNFPNFLNEVIAYCCSFEQNNEYSTFSCNENINADGSDVKANVYNQFQGGTHSCISQFLQNKCHENNFLVIIFFRGKICIETGNFYPRLSMSPALLQRIVRRWPGRETFGFLSFLPIFFVIGAGLEFCMIKWTVNDINFCMQ